MADVFLRGEGFALLTIGRTLPLYRWEYRVFASDQPLGRVIRAPLALLPKDWPLPIMSGPNRGKRWIVGSGTHGSWLGTYERSNAALVARLCEPQLTAFDVGANAGYFSLLLASRCRSVLAFEPDARNAGYLQRHLSINSIGNVEVVQAAVSDEVGMASFSGDSYMGHIHTEGVRRVPTVVLDGYATPDLIKMDIEGHELRALAGAKRILAERRTTWFVETHATDPSPIFRRLGYSVQLVGPHHLLATPAAMQSALD